MQIILTAKIRIHRNTPAAMTKAPPEKSVINPSLLRIGIRTDQNMGMGIDNRYTSVNALRMTVTKRLILETAGWQ